MTYLSIQLQINFLQNTTIHSLLTGVKLHVISE